MIVVSDTSPLRALAHLNLLSLLPEFFGEVWIPPTVARELEHPRGAVAPLFPQRFPWLRIEAPRDAAQVAELLKQLDRGEAEAIALARELKASGILVDESEARAVAKQMGFEAIGTLGLLIRAKQANRVILVRPLVDRLRKETRFYVSDALYDEVVRLAGE
jgi:uncharacterized protein